MKTEILLGDEAVALGAVHAGLTAAYSYPGTPATEIMEYLLRASDGGKKFRAAWCVNEKVAYEEALGVSFAGRRALVSMKHVGLNVAADPFMNSALTGAVGGLVVASADDPGMHSSQNEQDSRFFAEFARIFCLEPSDQQEAYDLTCQAFELSEKLDLPVMIRLVTRLAHSRSSVVPGEPRPQNELKFGAPRDWTLLPINARRRFRDLLQKQTEMLRLSEESGWNRLILNEKEKSFGIIASGIAYNYVLESLGDMETKPSILKVSAYPLPRKMVEKLAGQVDSILVVEEGYPLIEEKLAGLLGPCGKTIRGKLSGHLPASGELTPEMVRGALELPRRKQVLPAKMKLAGRPPQLCAGCPHTDTFKALKKALEGFPAGRVFSDIGCYTLGAFPPHNAVDTCVCMGASVGMAKGGAEAGIYPSVAAIGDSTFAHSGLTSLLDAAAANTDMTVIILDNTTVAMTGGQESYGSGQRLLRMIEGLGVPKDHIRTMVPLPRNLAANVEILKQEIGYRGLSVIVSARECLEEARKKKRN